MRILAGKSPGAKPKPDNQGNADTCTRHGMAKGMTGGLDDGRFGIKVDVSQDYVTQALVNKGHDVGGRWPTDFDQETILVMDRPSQVYYKVDMKVAECTYPELVQNWNTSVFVVVYKRFAGSHCVYVYKLANGKLCCMNSHGNTDQFPQLNPSKCQIYKIDATVKRASDKAQMSPTTKMRNSKDKQAELENAQLKERIMALEKAQKEKEDENRELKTELEQELKQKEEEKKRVEEERKQKDKEKKKLEHELKKKKKENKKLEIELQKEKEGQTLFQSFWSKVSSFKK